MGISEPKPRQTTAKMAAHPSAIGSFEKIMAAAEGKQVVVFLDYDGTLSPIVAHPDRALISPEMRSAVKDVAKLFPTAIVSGRSRSKVYDLVGLPELYYAGSHGMDIKAPRHGNDVVCQPAREFLPLIDRVCKILTAKMDTIPGALVENNKFCLSVHFRCVDEQRWGEVAGEVTSVMKECDQLRLTHGRKVLEIRPAIQWDKGNAVQFLLDSLGYTKSHNVLPIYIGDDRTDEDAFKVLRNRGQGIGILVSKTPTETFASYTLQDPSEVQQFLRRLVNYNRSRATPATLRN
ncbi:hypothetical protein M569_02812 [Genlisea aurea]|uniref:Trehalose 6-phosphate phosphatase n=1 Tax=Genlisea aurea TaxID=192259 RepID=S8CY79_9LAMI|nr:hypothetical protein M569_02812 [Genlisea aurea]